MPSLTYTRIDHQIVVDVAPAVDGAQLSVTAAGATLTANLAPGGSYDLGALIAHLPALPPMVPRRSIYELAPITVDRVTLRTPPTLAGLPWAQMLQGWAAGRPVVRIGSAPPGHITRPLPLPLRIAEVGLPDERGIGHTPNGHELRSFVDGFTQSARREFHVEAVQTMATMARRLHDNVRDRDWPTVDVLRLGGRLPADTLDPDPEGPPGSLGWLEHAAAQYQVRLVVLTIDEVTVLTPARQLAARLGDRGGPAVLIVLEAPPGLVQADFHEVVGHLIHDEPLDAIASQLTSAELFAGAGREDALRVSAGARQVVEQPPRVAEALNRLGLPVVAREAASHAVDALRDRWESLDYSGEGRGMFPSARILADFTSAVGPAMPPRGTYEQPQPPGQQSAQPQVGRFVNAHLHHSTADGRPGATLGQLGPALQAQGHYVLGIDVGPLAVHVAPADPVELLFEDQLWEADGHGLWTEVSVAGIGCTILGEPVQPLWVPRHGPSEPRLFPVRLGAPGTAVIRYTIYHRNQVVQSFRLAAIVGTSGAGRVTAAQRRALAKDLGLELRDVGQRAWHSRLDFSTVARVDDARALPGRTVTIVANHAGDLPLITVKGGRSFEAHVPKDLDSDVRAVRKALNEVSRPDGSNYGFGLPGDPNAADQAYYDFALCKLAEAGTRLWSRVEPIKPGEADDLRRDLAHPGATISVAHVLRDKVVPWALVYDRPYDAGRGRSRGMTVEHVACAAPLPVPGQDPASATLSATTCGTHPDCQLHPARVSAREQAGAATGTPTTVTPESVACPLGFWGFRHQLELPPQQVGSDGTTRKTEQKIEAGTQPRVLLGFNATLTDLASHRSALSEAMGRTRRRDAWQHLVTDRDDVVDALADAELDVVYLYCHALGGEGDADQNPRLQFQEPTDPQPRTIAAYELREVHWSHHPLVMLNACGTTGFSSTATSVFLEALVDRRYAAAVLGADVPVHEYLAAEIGTAVVAGILDERPVGAALNQARLALLARRNPLGLVYTLYGSLELHLGT